MPLTPAELHAHVQGLMSSEAPAGSSGRPLAKMLEHLSSPNMADNACFSVTSMMHKFLPEGSRMVRMMMQYSEGNPVLGGHHYLHHVPTTEGPYVVDFSHRQFDPEAPHPLVEPVEAFNQREAAQQRRATKVLSTRSAQAAAATAEPNGPSSYTLQMRWQKRHEARND